MDHNNLHHHHLNSGGMQGAGGIVLKSQISTIPEEEMDQEFGNGLHTDHQSSNFNGTGTHINLQSARRTLGVEYDDSNVGEDEQRIEDGFEINLAAVGEDRKKATSATLL